LSKVAESEMRRQSRRQRPIHFGTPALETSQCYDTILFECPVSATLNLLLLQATAFSGNLRAGVLNWSVGEKGDRRGIQTTCT
jgi:hypothetical protein